MVMVGSMCAATSLATLARKLFGNVHHPALAATLMMGSIGESLYALTAMRDLGKTSGKCCACHWTDRNL